jgi:hypothetical protein
LRIETATHPASGAHLTTAACRSTGGGEETQLVLTYENGSDPPAHRVPGNKRLVDSSTKHSAFDNLPPVEIRQLTREASSGFQL